MNKIIFPLLISFFFVAENIAQTTTSPINLNYEYCDSIIEEIWEKEDYISAIYYINFFLNFDTTKAYLYYNRAVAKSMLNDLNGACEDISIAKELHYEFTNLNKKYFKYICDTTFRAEKLGKYFYDKVDLHKDLNYRPIYTEKDSLRGMLNHSRSCYDVTSYNLKIKIIPQKKYIYGSTDVYFKLLENTSTIQLDLFENYQIDSIIRNMKKLDFTRNYDAVFIHFDHELQTNENDVISVYYQGKPQIAENPPWFGGFVWKRDHKMKRLIGVCCEHLGASSWWPNKDHLSDKPDSMFISIEVPEDYMAISNGNLLEEKNIGEKYKRYTWKVNYPMVNYNATFYCGNYIQISDSMKCGDNTISLDYYMLPQDKSKALAIFEQSKDVLEVYSDLFGPYPFPDDGFGLVESPYAGMEHQGAIAFGNKFRRRLKRYDNNDYDYIIVHEIAHEWWGNAVSFSDMADAWLSEGFATYSEMLFMEYKFGYKQYLKEISRIMQTIFNFWPVVGNYNVNENTFASGDIYNKGAITLNNLRCVYNNDSLFMKLLQDYFQKYKYQSVGTDKFKEMASAYLNKDLDPFFNKFLYDAKPPVLSYNLKLAGDDIVFYYKWTGVESGFSMPFSIYDNNKKQYTLNGTTSKSFIRIKNVEVIKFVLTYLDEIEIEKNSITYFRTKIDPNL